ncbi:MAG: bifunctional nuclease family protein [Calditrichia bacterium]|nr:bifunctional nuclease family protein [Calditrichota bacterium]MCB0267436.1 bifunctional nuclease family protein [Calditrichota bacterium]MCB0286481.1 bifunctional nuclease family protein [Calditrichota bacterium]MCB9070304.1 bifunctional nuclease family protein [Calditrichia bacterium]
MIEAKINGLFLTQAQTSGVILKEINGDRTLPIIIGDNEASSIALGLENVAPPRPITHDLFLNTLDALKARIERVIITDLRNNTYYALIELRSNSELMEIDARPSDAIALAVRRNVPIFIKEEVMNKGAFSSDEEFQNISEQQIDSEENRLDQLRRELQEAVEKEDYERAAEIRDRINRLESRS